MACVVENVATTDVHACPHLYTISIYICSNKHECTRRLPEILPLLAGGAASVREGHACVRGRMHAATPQLERSSGVKDSFCLRGAHGARSHHPIDRML